MAEDQKTEEVKRIAANIEDSYQLLRKTARNISGLLTVGRASCDEVKAYNLYALAIYNTQRGMLTRLRALGEKNVPDLPQFPTLFAWKNVKGEETWKIDCSAAGMAGPNLGFKVMPLGAPGLSSVLAAAMTATSKPGTVYLSSNEIKIITSDQQIFVPEGSVPSLAQVTQQGQLQGIFIPILIAGVALLIGIAAVAGLSAYFKESTIQEETSNRTKIQAQAFESYTATRMKCYDSCVSGGNSVEGCVKQCSNLVEKPELIIDAQREATGLGTLGIIGLVALAAAGGFLVFKLRSPRSDHRPRMIPSGDDD